MSAVGEEIAAPDEVVDDLSADVGDPLHGSLDLEQDRYGVCAAFLCPPRTRFLSSPS